MSAEDLLDLLPRGEGAAADDAAADCIAAWFETVEDGGGAPDVTRLLADAAGPKRFRGAAAALASLFDVTEREATSMLDGLDDEDDEWSTTLPGIRIRFAAGGPALGARIATFLEVAPGARFPLHDHDAPETSLLIQGACREDSGVIFGAGDTIERLPGEAHAFSTVGGRPAVFALVSGSISFQDEAH